MLSFWTLGSEKKISTIAYVNKVATRLWRRETMSTVVKGYCVLLRQVRKKNVDRVRTDLELVKYRWGRRGGRCRSRKTP